MRHIFQQIVSLLQQVLRSHAGYIGMLGSRTKRDKIYQSLVEEGYEREKLQTVFSPIGLDIAAETPEEIAVSIVAELIKGRAEREKCIKTIKL